MNINVSVGFELPMSCWDWTESTGFWKFNEDFELVVPFQWRNISWDVSFESNKHIDETTNARSVCVPERKSEEIISE